MKLLFDHNLSPRLVNKLRDIFPDSQHLYQLGLDRSEDMAIWNYARINDFTITTRDADFNEIGLIRGFPPKTIWIRRGNCSTTEIESILRNHYAPIQTFINDPSLRILTLY